jgi:hypothetical protein
MNGAKISHKLHHYQQRKLRTQLTQCEYHLLHTSNMLASCSQMCFGRWSSLAALTLLLLQSAALGQVSKPYVSDKEHATLAGANRFLESDIVRCAVRDYSIRRSPPSPRPHQPFTLPVPNNPLLSPPCSMERHIFRTDASSFDPNPVCP